MADQLDLLSAFVDGTDEEIRYACWMMFLHGQTREAWEYYRASGPYLKLKRQRMLRAQFRCERQIGGTRCPAKDELQLHHLTYARRFFEDINDVRILCRPCHIERSGGGDDLPMAAAAA
jgi:hypothetical protein